MATATVGKYPAVLSVGTTQLEVTFEEPDRLYTATNLSFSSTGGTSTTAIFCLLDGSTGAVATTYNSSTGAGKLVIQSGVSAPIPVIRVGQFKVASGTVAMQVVSTPRGNYFPDST